MPSSSARAAALSTSSGSSTPTSGPSANALSYSTRAERPSLVFRIRSHPIEHEAQDSRTAARSSSASVVVSVPKLRPGQRRERVEREQVRERAHAAVLRGGGAERARAQVLRRCEHGLRVGDRALLRRAHRDGLQPLRPHHGAEPAAARVATVVRDGREAHEPLARGPDRRDAVGGAEPLAQPRLGVGGGEAPEVGRVDHARAALVDDERARRVAGAAHDDRVMAGQLARDREVARRERVVQAVGQRRLRHDRELRARRQRRADERREHEHQRRSGRQRLDARRRERVQQVRAEPAAADARAQDVVLQRQHLAARPVEVDDERPAEVAARRHAQQGYDAGGRSRGRRISHDSQIPTANSGMPIAIRATPSAVSAPAR